MTTKAMIIVNETGGGVPVDCEITMVKGHLKISYGGLRGFTVSVRVEDVQNAIMEDTTVQEGGQQ